jgi:deoxyribonucleoside regulator
MSQVDIGAKMEMSRWKIGRIIKDARERGLVTITLNHPQIDLTETEVLSMCLSSTRRLPKA